MQGMLPGYDFFKCRRGPIQGTYSGLFAWHDHRDQEPSFAASAVLQLTFSVLCVCVLLVPVEMSMCKASLHLTCLGSCDAAAPHVDPMVCRD